MSNFLQKSVELFHSFFGKLFYLCYRVDFLNIAVTQICIIAENAKDDNNYDYYCNYYIEHFAPWCKKDKDILQEVYYSMRTMREKGRARHSCENEF